MIPHWYMVLSKVPNVIGFIGNYLVWYYQGLASSRSSPISTRSVMELGRKFGKICDLVQYNKLYGFYVLPLCIVPVLIIFLMLPNHACILN